MMRLTWLVGLAATGLLGCGSIQKTCEGDEGCACFANDTCMKGLSCLSHLCVDDSRHDPSKPSEVDSATQSELDSGKPSASDASASGSETTGEPNGSTSERGSETTRAPDASTADSTSSEPRQESSTELAGIASHPSRWFRADQGIEFADTGRIEQWLDQSGQRGDAIMGDDPRRPVLVAEALNGKPEVEFDGAQSVYFPTFESVQFTLFAVGRNSNPTEYHSIIIGPGGDTGNNQLRWDDGGSLMFVGLDINIPVTVFPFGDTRVPHLVSVRYDGASLEAYRNTELMGGLETVSTGVWNVAQLGGWFSSDFMIGSLSEVVMYDRSLSDRELEATQTALVEKYGL